MPDLVTIDEARAHLRLDADSNGGPDDLWLSIFIPAISQSVELWLKDEWRLYVPEIDSSGDVVVDSAGDPVPAVNIDGDYTPKHVVKAAVLVELDNQYQFRSGQSDADVPSHAGYGYVLNKASTALLAPLRKPTAA